MSFAQNSYYIHVKCKFYTEDSISTLLEISNNDSNGARKSLGGYEAFIGSRTEDNNEVLDIQLFDSDSNDELYSKKFNLNDGSLFYDTFNEDGVLHRVKCERLGFITPKSSS